MLDNNFEITNALVCDTVDINMTSFQEQSRLPMMS